MADSEFEAAFGDVDAAPQDADVIPELPEPPVLTPPNTQQLSELGDNIQSLRDELRASELNEQKIRLVDTYYNEISEAYKLSPSKIPYDQFKDLVPINQPGMRGNAHIVGVNLDMRRIQMNSNLVVGQMAWNGIAVAQHRNQAGGGHAREHFHVSIKWRWHRHQIHLFLLQRIGNGALICVRVNLLRYPFVVSWYLKRPEWQGAPQMVGASGRDRVGESISWYGS